MGRFLQVITHAPTVAFTVVLGVALVYWVTVVLGALDIEVLGGPDHADAGDAGGDAGDAGDADGGDADGHGDGDGHDGHDGAHTHAHAHGHDGLLGALGGTDLRRVPTTVRVSFVAVYAWLASTLGALALEAPAARAGVPHAAFAALLGVVALVVGMRLAGYTVRPLAAVFERESAQKKSGLVGRVAEVSTGRLDAGFGQVLVKDGGAGLVIDARHEGPALTRGVRVVVVSWDDERGVATVEPLDGDAQGPKRKASSESG